MTTLEDRARAKRMHEAAPDREARTAVFARKLKLFYDVTHPDIIVRSNGVMDAYHYVDGTIVLTDTNYSLDMVSCRRLCSVCRNAVAAGTSNESVKTLDQLGRWAEGNPDGFCHTCGEEEQLLRLYGHKEFVRMAPTRAEQLDAARIYAELHGGGG